MREGYGEIKRQEVSAEDEETAEFKKRASAFIKDAEGMSLEGIGRTLDDSYSGKIESDDIVGATNLEELQARAKKQLEARQLYGEIMGKLYPQE